MDYCITGFMKQIQCNATPSLNEYPKNPYFNQANQKNTCQIFLSLREQTAFSARVSPAGETRAEKAVCSRRLNFPTQKNPGIENFKPKKSFDHPRHLKSRVPPPHPLGFEHVAVSRKLSFKSSARTSTGFTQLSAGNLQGFARDTGISGLRGS